MAFCINCGKELEEGAIVCSACDTAIPNYQTTNENKRKIVYEGEIRKCPACGEVIEAFIAICPSCGFELNGQKTCTNLQLFIGEIDKCEKKIEYSGYVRQSGWSSWSKMKRFWWVMLNIFFICIPLVIYLVLPFVTIKLTPKLSPEEKTMALLIQNYTFPNDRETILSALVFVKEKINFISKEDINRKTVYWMRLWCTKAEQLKQKADMLFPNDSIVKNSYNEIAVAENLINNKIKNKAIIGIGIIAILIVIYTALGIIGKDNPDSTTSELETTSLSEELQETENYLF